jgi:hypothetical protein
MVIRINGFSRNILALIHGLQKRPSGTEKYEVQSMICLRFDGVADFAKQYQTFSFIFCGRLGAKR